MTDLDWTAISPAASIQPGKRTGKFRLGKDHLIEDDKGQSLISREDFAVAIMDEIEKPRHIRQKFTAATRAATWTRRISGSWQPLPVPAA